MKPSSFFVILFFMALITACSKKADDSSSVTPVSGTPILTNTQLIAKSLKHQTIDIALPTGDTVNLFTRGGTHNADVRDGQANFFLAQDGGWKGYFNSDQVGSGNWKFTDNESTIIFTGDINETRIITQLTYYKWDYKLIYDPVKTPNTFVISEALFARIDISKGATFIFKLVPN